MARQLLQQEKTDRAKCVLRRKRYKESLLAKTDTQLDNLDAMVGEIEMAEIQVCGCFFLPIFPIKIEQLNRSNPGIVVVSPRTDPFIHSCRYGPSRALAKLTVGSYFHDGGGVIHFVVAVFASRRRMTLSTLAGDVLLFQMK